MNFAFHIAQVEDDIVMIAIVGQYIAAGAEWSPADACLVQLMNQSGSLRFCFRSDHPVDCAANAQTRQLGKTSATFGAQTQFRSNLLDHLNFKSQITQINPDLSVQSAA